MLAQNFKTAEELGLGEAELAAHITVLGMLERGELKHIPEPSYRKRQNGFNMSFDGLETPCGTVACIGGWVAVILGDKATWGYVAGPAIDTPRRRLYWPLGGDDVMKTITTSQAAMALRNYLTTGEPRWEEVLS